MKIEKVNLPLSLLALSLAMLTAQLAFAQPDNGEDPIQGKPKPSLRMQDNNTPIARPRTPGMFGATPIEIPLWARIDPHKNPNLFKPNPVPIPGKTIVQGRHGKYAFKENERGLIMGQTRFGYAYFSSRSEYFSFVRRYP